MIKNNCIHFKCDFIDEWCIKYGSFKCKDCPYYSYTDDESVAGDYE